MREHDTIARRLSSILVKFNSGERFTVDELCEEFHVDKRTIQRDLNDRLAFFPIKKENGYYSLESYALGKLSFDDVKNFAAISGVKHLFPSLSNDFITDILNTKIQSAYLVKSPHYENLAPKSDVFASLSTAILNNISIRCTYRDKIRLLHPYKLVNHHGIWYLVADDMGILKNFSFSKITDFEILDNERFIPNPHLLETLKDSESNWFSQAMFDVILNIDPSVRTYFLERKILPNQTVLKNTASTLIVKARVSYDEEILRIVQYWMPHITIMEPEYLQIKLNEVLEGYLKTT